MEVQLLNLWSFAQSDEFQFNQFEILWNQSSPSFMQVHNIRKRQFNPDFKYNLRYKSEGFCDNIFMVLAFYALSA